MRVPVAAVLLLLLSGCFQSVTTLTVRPDGTATLRDEVTLSGMALIAAAEDDGSAFSRDDTDERLAALGGGAQLVTFEAREDGYTAIYAIDDVEGMTLRPPAGTSEATDALSTTFRFETGDPSVLRVLVPKPTPSKPEAPTETDDNREMAQQMLGMMRSMMGDARITMAVEVEGDLVDTNATAVEDGRVTVLDFPVARMLDFVEENDDFDLGTSNPAEQMDRLRAIEGVVIPMPGTTRIRFR